MSTQFAYVVIDPHPGVYPHGIKRYRNEEVMEADKRGQYMVYIKIGDTGDPKQRLQHYVNPSQCIGYASIKNVPDPRKKVGKQLEDDLLAKVGETDTEWHALYAKNLAGMEALTSALWDFVKAYKFKKEQPDNYNTVGYNTFSKEIATAIENRFKDHGRDGLEVQPKTPIVSYGVYVIVTPSLFSLSQGLAQTDKPQDGKYLISIKTIKSEGSYPMEMVHRNLKTVIPSFSFNGFVVSTSESQCKMKELKEYQLDRMLTAMNGCKKSWASREWTSITGSVDKPQLQAFVKEFGENLQEELNTKYTVNLYLESRPAEEAYHKIPEGNLRPMFMLKIRGYNKEDVLELKKEVPYPRLQGVVQLQDSPYIWPANIILKKWFDHEGDPNDWVNIYGNIEAERDQIGNALRKFMRRYPIDSNIITQSSFARFCRALSKLSDAIPIVDSEIPNE